MVLAACILGLQIPAMSIAVAKDNHIETMITIVGKATTMYYPQPLKASMFIGRKAGLTFFEQ